MRTHKNGINIEKSKLVLQAHNYNLSMWKAEQKDCCVFEVIINYILSSDPASNKTKQNKIQYSIKFHKKYTDISSWL